MNVRKTIFYTTENGDSPVENFLLTLDKKVMQKIVWVLKLLEDLKIIPGHFFKKLQDTDNIWECRIEYQSNIYRILCFFHEENIVVLTNGFQKKTQKTPKKEIELAEKYKKDYLRRTKI